MNIPTYVDRYKREAIANCRIRHRLVNPINLLLVYPNGRNGTMTAVDTVNIYVDNPAHPTKK